MESQNPEIHGHEVINMVREGGADCDVLQLKAKILDRFGPEARFYTCSASGLTADGIIQFLTQQGKLATNAQGLTTVSGEICDHR